MSRLFTSGLEVQMLSNTAPIGGESDNSNVGAAGTTTSGGLGTPTIDNTNQRSGAACVSMNAASTQWRIIPSSITTGRTYYLRGYMRFSANPAGTITIFRGVLNALNVMEVRMTTGGAIGLFDESGQIGSNSSALSTGTYYRIEIEFNVAAAGANAGTLGLFIDGVQLARSTTADLNNSGATPQLQFGCVTATAPSATFYWDDFALNDDQGSSQNSFPGVGKVLFLPVVSDNANGNSMEVPQTTGSDTTNIFDACNNIPPVGVAHSDVDANNNLYCFTIANSTGYMDFNVRDYATAGIQSQDQINVVQALVRASVNSTTGTNDVKFRVSSNPADIGDAIGDTEISAVAGTEPAGWKTYKGDPVHAPSVTLGTQPVLRVGKSTGTTRALMVDLAGIQVDYTVGVRPPPTVELVAVNRASVR